MGRCSVTKNMNIVKGGVEDYTPLSQFHYRGGRLGAFVAIFAIRPAIGVIVYTMPTAGCQLREVATAGTFSGFDRSTRLKLINRDIRCISRVIIEPRFRGLGLAHLLVQETMPLLGVPIVESMAVMGLVNPFFVKAGMSEFIGPMAARCVQMAEALSIVGIEDRQLVDAVIVQDKLRKLDCKKRNFIELQIQHFLQSYGRRRMAEDSLERTRFVLSRLTYRPAYYIWFNPEKGHSDT